MKLFKLSSLLFLVNFLPLFGDSPDRTANLHHFHIHYPDNGALSDEESVQRCSSKKRRKIRQDERSSQDSECEKRGYERKHYVNMHLGGRLGNQLFQIAAALSLAEDFGADAIFPEFANRVDNDIPSNRIHFFSSLNVGQPTAQSEYIFQEHPHFIFTPIPYRPNMEIHGYFQSEKYFKHNWIKIRKVFEPSQMIKEYLAENYQVLLEHPNTVAIHLRAYKLESLEIEKCFPFLPGEYYMKAAEQFPADALFVIFSDKMDWAESEMKNFSRPHIFINNEPYYHDFYLMSFCKHQIISASSFSWWAAYLNRNPNKVVIAPTPWFSPISGHDSSHVIPDGWRTLSWLP